MSVLANLAEIGLQGFIDVYRQVQEEHPEQTEPFKPSELRKLMWARMAANESGMEKKSFKIPYENLKKTKLQFPYMPNDIRYTGCCAIKKNGDLYTPCCGKTKDSYCLSCTMDKEGNAKVLPYGSVEDREQNIANGKFTPITYGTWLKKAKKTIDQVYGVLGDNGISLMISAEELQPRETPKNRKGRPAKSDDSAGSKKSKTPKTPEPEEDDGYSSAASSISSKSSQGSKSKKSKAPEPEPEDEDAEPEPVKAKKSKKPKAPEPEDEAPVKAKAEKPKKKSKAPEPEDEPAPVKAKKDKKEKKDKAEKAEKAEKPKKAEKAEKPKKDKAEKAEKPKKDKAEKAEKPKKTPEPEESDDEPIGSMELQPEEEEMEEETRIISGKKYMRTGDSAVIYDERGTVVGSVNDEGEWMDNAGEEMVDEAEFSDDE